MYLVIAYRWGDPELHSYPVGLYGCMKDAGNAAVSEQDWRGGKYECKIYFVTESDGWNSCRHGLVKEVQWNYEDFEVLETPRRGKHKSL